MHHVGIVKASNTFADLRDKFEGFLGEQEVEEEEEVEVEDGNAEEMLSGTSWCTFDVT